MAKTGYSIEVKILVDGLKCTVTCYNHIICFELFPHGTAKHLSQGGDNNEQVTNNPFIECQL